MALWVIVNEATGQVEQFAPDGEEQASEAVEVLNEWAGSRDVRHLTQRVRFRAAEAEELLTEVEIAAAEANMEREGVPPGTE
jgi:hypothetical protein